MTMRKDVKSSLISALETGLDAYMSEHRFERGKNSLLYKRVVASSTQVIDISFEVHPKDTPAAVAALYPTMEVLVPAVDAVLKAMVGGASGALRGYSDARSKQPIGFTSEKADPGRWYLRQLSDLPATVEEVRAFLDRWTMPLLDVYATPEDMVAAEERGDGRVVRDRPQLIRVVAAALVCGRRDFAQALMEKHLGAPGARRMYQQVFDYIQRAA
ncbi:hypothetical protein ASD89_23745 [Caulobacter sp. Root656]|nr:hypothetical protein ASD89_23745 [Caulobacter sp. Root656]